MPNHERSPEEIQRELADARGDLAARLSALEHAVREKIDVKARARVAVERARQRTIDGVMRAREDVRAHPVRYGAILFALVAVSALLIVRAYRARLD